MKKLKNIVLLLSVFVVAASCKTNNDKLPFDAGTVYQGAIIDISRTAGSNRLFDDYENPANQALSTTISIDPLVSAGKPYNKIELFFVDEEHVVKSDVVRTITGGLPYVFDFSLKDILDAFNLEPADLTTTSQFSVRAHVYYDGYMIPGFVDSAKSTNTRYPQENLVSQISTASVAATYNYGYYIDSIQDLVGRWLCSKDPNNLGGGITASTTATIALDSSDATQVIITGIFGGDGAAAVIKAKFDRPSMTLSIPQTPIADKIVSGATTYTNLEMTASTASVFKLSKNDKIKIKWTSVMQVSQGSFGTYNFLMTKQ